MIHRALSASDEGAPADGEIRSADGKLLKDWRVRERRFVEEMTPDTLRQTLTAAVAIPDLQSASVYQPMRQVRWRWCEVGVCGVGVGGCGRGCGAVAVVCRPDSGKFEGGCKIISRQQSRKYCETDSFCS